MKQLSILSASIFMLCACAPTYYQLATVASNEAILTEKNNLKYEDSDITIEYDFWAEKGTVTFIATNKTDELVFIDLDRSFFILNGMANDYSKTGFSHTADSQNTSPFSLSFLSSSNGEGSLGYPGRKNSDVAIAKNNIEAAMANPSTAMYIEAIPPHASKMITGFSLMKDVYKGKTPNFTADDSPFTYRVYLTLVKDSKEEVVIEHNFYISEIQNYSEIRALSGKDMIKDGAANRFFLKTKQILSRLTSNNEPVVADNSTTTSESKASTPTNGEANTVSNEWKALDKEGANLNFGRIKNGCLIINQSYLNPSLEQYLDDANMATTADECSSILSELNAYIRNTGGNTKSNSTLYNTAMDINSFLRLKLKKLNQN